jgi:hypothetical protein
VNIAVIPWFEYDFAKPFAEGMALVNVAGKWGYIRKP